MQLFFLGGASEVGASCLVVEAAGRRVLVDAGIRMHAADALPDLSRLQELGGIDAVVVTHAHADHIGALPLAAGAFPLAPVIATPATAGLMAVMLEDAIRVGEARAENGGDLPAYGRPQVTALLERLRPLPTGHPHPLFPAAGEADWLLTFFPAGHVLGAALALLETPEGNVLVSGDISLTPQLTVGSAVPPRQRVDLFVLESTYGNRLHSQRAAEEARLVAQIHEILERGGHCLVPAFALGRAQEVLLILAAARRRGELVGPVWVDGLVRPVCGVYQAYADAGSHVLRRLVARQGNPFIDADGPVRAIQRPEERSRVLAGPPAVIVASSGMLTGGPSAFYAAKLAGDERHGILITGYQDEEAPGRRLLDLAQAATLDRHLALDGVEIPVRCTVSRYNLSAHADGDELASFAERVRPGLTCLVHGDDEARASLADKLLQRQLDCRLPRNGDTVELTVKRGRPAPSSRPAPTEDKLLALAGSAHPSRGWTALELAERYYGHATPAGVAAVAEILHSADSFVADRIRPMLYRASPSPTSATAQAWGPTSQERARQRAEETFGADPTFVKVSLYPNQRRLELRFHYPDVARVRHAAAVTNLAAELGWEMTFRQTPDQNALQAAAKRTLPAELRSVGEPSVRVDLQRVEVSVRGDLAPAPLAAAVARFAAETGYQLVVHGEEPAEPSGDDGTPEDIPADGAPSPEPSPSGLPRLEQNLAFATIRESLEVDGAQVFRISGRGNTLEVVFLTPAIGRRYQPQLRALEQSLGWPLTFASQPQQGVLIDIVKTIVDRPLARTPGVFPAEERVRVRLSPGETPSAADIQTWQQAVLEATGYRLQVETM